MMTLLYAHSLTENEQFMPESMPLNLSERQSTATIIVGEDAPEISVGDWIRDDTEPGQGIVWRVKTVDTQHEKKTRTIQLEHIINTLRDTILFGEVKPSDISGGTTCTAIQAITYALARQSDWTLGTCSYSVSNPYNFNGDSLYDVIETVSSSLEDCWWDYDMSSYPFTLNILERAEAVSTELRMSRNIQTAKTTVDISRMYTRIYPIGKNNLHIDGNYRSKNENIYGRIDKTVTDQSKETKAELQRWADELLDRHCEPSVTVTVSALDLSKETNETLDHIVLGAMCRMPLEGYDTTITETITKINYPDKIAEPERATVTLANSREDVASIINQLIKSGGGSGRTHAKQGEEDHAWIVDTTDHVTLVAEAFIGKDGQNPVDWSRVAQLGVDQNGISGRVTLTENGLITAQSQITVNENAITAEVTRATGAESSLSSAIVVEAGRITQEVSDRQGDVAVLQANITVEAGRITQEVTDRQNADTTLDGRITVEAGKITQIVTAVGDDGEVTAASICLAINGSNDSSATINASKIYLLGQTIADTITANYISSKIASLSVLNVAAISATGNIHTDNGYIMAPYYYLGTPGNARSLTTGIWALRITSSGNTYTLQKQDFDDSDWVDVGNFSRATTLSAQWDGSRKFTVSASPQGNSRYTTLMSAVPNANVSWNGTVATIALKATIDDGETAIDVGNITMDVANFLQNKTGTNKFTSNGTYTASSGYLGYGQITIDVPQSTGAQNVQVRFNGSSGSYYIEAFDSVSGNPISGANRTYKLGLSGTKVQIQNTSGTLIGAEYQVPLQSSRTLTANGTYTPSSGNIGIASVTVNVPSDLPNAKARFNVSSGQYYIEAFDNVSTNPISGSNVNYKLGFSGTKVQIQNSSGSKLRNTPELTLGMSQGSVNSSGSRTLTVTAGGSNTTVTATITDYASGWAAARTSTGDFPTAAVAEANRLQYITTKRPNSTVGGTATSYNYYVTSDNNKAYIRYNSTSGNIIAQVTHNKYSSGVTDGKNAVGLTINANNAKITRNQSSNSITEVQISVDTGSVNGSGNRTITVKANSTTLLTNVISDYANGKTAVWNGVSISNTGGTTYSVQSGSGASKVIRIPFQTVVSSSGMTNKTKDDYWQQTPTNIWHDAYTEGMSNASHTITNYSTSSPIGASVTISGTTYSNSSRMYAITSGSGKTANVIIVTTGSWKCDGKARESNANNYLQQAPTNIYRDGWTSGFDASHNLFIGDTNYTAQPGVINITPGSDQEVWAYFKKSDGSTYQWSSKYTLHAVNPYPNSYTLVCSGKTQTYPGSTIYNYTFTLGGSSASFSTGTSYTFHR